MKKETQAKFQRFLASSEQTVAVEALREAIAALFREKYRRSRGERIQALVVDLLKYEPCTWLLLPRWDKAKTEEDWDSLENRVVLNFGCATNQMLMLLREVRGRARKHVDKNDVKEKRKGENK
jgi:hypothetical protein